MDNDKFVFFWGGPFSQWYKRNMVIHGVEYNCAEQYMMAMKAAFFGDFDTQDKIMKSKDPKKQKELGRSVKNFDPVKWSSISKKFVYEANCVKFSDPILQKYLLSTGDKEIVEASPYDTIWGIGLSETDPDRFDKSKWRGTNWLGEVLMKVREELKNS